MIKREADPREGETTFYVDGHDIDGNQLFVRTEHIVTSVRVKPEYASDRVSLWNRGASCGSFVVNKGDGEEVARRLLQEDLGQLLQFRDKASVLLSCSSPDGSAELGQIETLIEISRDEHA
jgi:hypothetical protein